MSSSGADKSSFFLYPKTKGEAEEAVGNMDFEKAAMYRPKYVLSLFQLIFSFINANFNTRLLLAEREETRIGEKIGFILAKPFQYLAPTLLTTPIETLAKSIIANTIFKKAEDKKIQIIDNTEIFNLAKLYDEMIKK